ncbi:Fatty acid synthase [Halotydeus destructor]|nr:Fatty acid synthase [Halotydeus destructor]
MNIVDKYEVLLEMVSSDIKAQDDGHVNDTPTRKRPLWLAMSSLGTQWPGMAKSLMVIPAFAKSIDESARVLQEVSLDLKASILDESREDVDIVDSFVGIVAIEIALVDVLYAAGLEADRIFGFSLGELGAGYADGAMSARETLLTAFHMDRGQRHVASDGGNLSGIHGEHGVIEQFMETLTAEGIFTKVLNLGGIGFHTEAVEASRDQLTEVLQQVLTEPKKRSPKWLSTAIAKCDWDLDDSKILDARYFVNQIVGLGHFHQIMPLIPEDAIVVEVGPSPMLLQFLKPEVGADVTLVPLLIGGQNDTNLDLFLTGLAVMAANGHQVAIEKLLVR